MRSMMLVTVMSLGLAMVGVAIAESSRVIGERQIRRTLRMAFPAARPDHRSRLVPDATMAACSQWRNEPPRDVAGEIRVRESARIRYPEDGVFIGDWKRGERIAQSGYGLRFTDKDPDRQNGGNCYACHQLSPDEVSFGTIGTSLEGYGRIHKFRPEEARAVYEKIYNSQAMVACSLMPRFGANGILSIDQIKDLVALLMDPDSPVNRKPSSGEAGGKSGAVRGIIPGKR